MFIGTLAAFSNEEDWIITSPLINDDGDEVTLTDATLVFYITKPESQKTALLTATTANGKITLPTATTFQIAFTPTDVADICPGTYSAFLRAIIDGIETQILSASVQCLPGGPTS